MAFFRKLFKGPRAYASTMPSFYGRWGEPKPLDQLRLLELAEGDAEVRACLDATVDAVTANGWYVTGLDEAKNAAELWLREHEDEFFLFLRNLVLTTLVFDESYIECTGGFPRVIAPWTMQVVRDEHGFVTGYVQQTRHVCEVRAGGHRPHSPPPARRQSLRLPKNRDAGEDPAGQA
jgi:hypothetical protein